MVSLRGSFLRRRPIGEAAFVAQWSRAPGTPRRGSRVRIPSRVFTGGLCGVPRVRSSDPRLAVDARLRKVRPDLTAAASPVG
jgi:hypothetical protein